MYEVMCFARTDSNRQRSGKSTVLEKEPGFYIEAARYYKKIWMSGHDLLCHHETTTRLVKFKFAEQMLHEYLYVDSELVLK